MSRRTWPKLTAKVLGKGAYGRVYSTADPRVACKVQLYDDEVDKAALREVAALSALAGCPEVVHCLGAELRNGGLHIYMDRYDKSLRGTAKMPEASVRRVIHSILRAMYYASEVGILHLDIKPDNILVSDRRAVLADWGLATLTSRDPAMAQSTDVQTRWYRAPEILLGAPKYTETAEVWSIACTWYELLRGKPLMDGDSEIDQIFRIFRLVGTPESGASTRLCHFSDKFPKFLPSISLRLSELPDGVITLMRRMFSLEPVDRPTLRICLQDPYFAEEPRPGPFVGLETTPLDTTYMDGWKDFTPSKRRIALDWIFAAAMATRMPLAIYFLASEYLDIFMAHRSFTLNSELIGIEVVCLGVACKVHSSVAFNLEDWLIVIGNRMSAPLLCELERELLRSLDMKLFRQTHYENFISGLRTTATGAAVALFYLLNLNIAMLCRTQDLQSYCNGGSDGGFLSSYLMTEPFRDFEIERARYIRESYPRPIVLRRYGPAPSVKIPLQFLELGSSSRRQLGLSDREASSDLPGDENRFPEARSSAES
jgi:serine/threonine protein kinase